MRKAVVLAALLSGRVLAQPLAPASMSKAVTAGDYDLHRRFRPLVYQSIVGDAT